MGWYETKVYQSAMPQIPATIEAILNDPYLMPPSPLFSPVFEYLVSGDIDDRFWAEEHVRGILEDIIWNLHHSVKQIGSKDYAIDLLEFWKHLVKEGEKDSFHYFESEGAYPTGFNTCGRFAPVCIFAYAKYDQAIFKMKNRESNGFFKNPENI
jgi:hypothetical protein